MKKIIFTFLLVLPFSVFALNIGGIKINAPSTTSTTTTTNTNTSAPSGMVKVGGNGLAPVEQLHNEVVSLFKSKFQYVEYGRVRGGSENYQAALGLLTDRFGQPYRDGQAAKWFMKSSKEEANCLSLDVTRMSDVDPDFSFSAGTGPCNLPKYERKGIVPKGSYP